RATGSQVRPGPKRSRARADTAGWPTIRRRAVRAAPSGTRSCGSSTCHCAVKAVLMRPPYEVGSTADVHVDGAVLADLAAEARQLRIVRVDPAAGAGVELPQVLRAGQRLAVQVALVQGRGLVRAPVGVGPDGPVEVDEQHGLAVDRDGGHVAFP